MARPLVRLYWALPKLSRVLLLALVALLCITVYHWNSVTTDGGSGTEQSQSDANAAGERGGAVQLVDWEDYDKVAQAKRRSGNGEQGTGYNLPTDAETTKRKDVVFRMNGFNGLASEYISLFRAVKDIRHPQCRGKLYPKHLPSVSVVVPFHNEHNATLLRTVHSIVAQSDARLLREVVLSDDASTADWLKQPLDNYIAATFKSGLVKVVRAAQREGLIRARLRGARAATGAVLIFLDAHSECNYNWLPPLLAPIALDRKTAVCPFVDVIDYDTFEYRAQDEGARGAFDWLLYYKRLPLKAEHAQTPTEPFDDPVMAGGYFAIDTQWFWQLGGYDEGLEIWGGEQYELSFKIWQCGGRLVDAPCSRVGHIYRRYSPIGAGGGRGDYLSRNYKRVAAVWMDEYAEHIYSRRPHYRNLDPGDISKQLEVRRRLQCKPFDWFIKTVVPDIMQHYPPVEPEPTFSGRIRSTVDEKLCVDAHFGTKNQEIKLQQCEPEDSAKAGSEQHFQLTFRDDVRPRRRPICWDVPNSTDGSPVLLWPCHGQRGNQQWSIVAHDTKTGVYMVQHVPSKKCLENETSSRKVYVAACDRTKASQLWHVDNAKLK